MTHPFAAGSFAFRTEEGGEDILESELSSLELKLDSSLSESEDEDVDTSEDDSDEEDGAIKALAFFFGGLSSLSAFLFPNILLLTLQLRKTEIF